MQGSGLTRALGAAMEGSTHLEVSSRRRLLPQHLDVASRPVRRCPPGPLPLPVAVALAAPRERRDGPAQGLLPRGLFLLLGNSCWVQPVLERGFDAGVAQAVSAHGARRGLRMYGVRCKAFELQFKVHSVFTGSGFGEWGLGTQGMFRV